MIAKGGDNSDVRMPTFEPLVVASFAGKDLVFRPPRSANELREECRRRELPVWGNKIILEERIRSSDDATGRGHGDEASHARAGRDPWSICDYIRER